MRQLVTIVFCTLVIYIAKAQESQLPTENPGAYLNNFNKYTDSNADSAYYFIRKLASNQQYVGLLRELVHNSFAQDFTARHVAPGNQKRQLICRQILAKVISDTTTLLNETTRPMVLWIQAEQKKNDVAALTDLTNQYIKSVLSSRDVYTNSTGRYGLMIYEIVATHTSLKPLADKLLDNIYFSLEKNQVRATDSSSRADLDKRANQRYLYAYVNYTKAQQTDNITKKEGYLKTAFDFSPDLIDKNHQAEYFYDMIFLFDGEEKQTFKTDYLDFLSTTSIDKTKVLSLLLKTALVEPEYKAKLEEFYIKNVTSKKQFNAYWMDAINAEARIAPGVQLYQPDQKLFTSKGVIGKWVLLDFWGTWCAPCREEHPDMQKFYDSTVLKNANRITLMTIACRDTKEKVLAYLQDKQFSFPVAMSDNKIEETYKIQGYPTKILITPQGKYIIVPFGIDWVGFVKKYSGLE